MLQGIGHYVAMGSVGALSMMEEKARSDYSRLTQFQQPSNMFEAMLDMGVIKWGVTREKYAAALVAAATENPTAAGATLDALLKKHLGVAAAAQAYKETVALAKGDEAARVRAYAEEQKKKAAMTSDPARRRAAERKAASAELDARAKERKAEEATAEAMGLEKKGGGLPGWVLPVGAAVAGFLVLRRFLRRRPAPVEA